MQSPITVLTANFAHCQFLKWVLFIQTCRGWTMKLVSRILDANPWTWRIRDKEVLEPPISSLVSFSNEIIGFDLCQARDPKGSSTPKNPPSHGNFCFFFFQKKKKKNHDYVLSQSWLCLSPSASAILCPLIEIWNFFESWMFQSFRRMKWWRQWNNSKLPILWELFITFYVQPQVWRGGLKK